MYGVNLAICDLPLYLNIYLYIDINVYNFVYVCKQKKNCLFLFFKQLFCFVFLLTVINHCLFINLINH